MLLPQRPCVMFTSLSSHQSVLSPVLRGRSEERWIGHFDDVVCGLWSYELIG